MGTDLQTYMESASFKRTQALLVLWALHERQATQQEIARQWEIITDLDRQVEAE